MRHFYNNFYQEIILQFWKDIKMKNLKKYFIIALLLLMYILLYSISYANNSISNLSFPIYFIRVPPISGEYVNLQSEKQPAPPKPVVM